jgi:hypothetical protein
MNKTDLMGYAFQLYAIFVASSSEMTELYALLTQSILENQANWNYDMRYLMPS